jgi:sialic acid synthase SpsE
MSARFRVGPDWLGKDESTYFIADIAANHDGDLGRAFQLIEQAKESGANAAKFQNFQAPKIVSRAGFERLGGQLAHQVSWKRSVYEIYEAASLSKDWNAKLREHCDRVGITYLTSPYDEESVDLVEPLLGAYKIGSGDITFSDLLSYIAQKGKPILLATGASTLEDVRLALERIHVVAPQVPVCLMQCNTNYTGSHENFRHIHLNVLKTYGLLFPETLLGLSDHTPGHATVLGAVALGARVIEKHFTDDNQREGPDHLFSMNPGTWRDMVDRTRELELALGGSVKRIEPNEQNSAVVQRRSLYAARPIKEGHILSAEDVEALRPAPEGSFRPDEIHRILGLKAPKNYTPGDGLGWDDWR